MSSRNKTSKTESRRKGARITDAEAERMFKLYAKLREQGKGGYKQVGEKFGVPTSSVGRVAKKYDWKTRLKGISQQVQKSTDKSLAKSQMNNARLAIAVRNKTVQNFLTKADASRTTATDVVRILEYCDHAGVGGDADVAGTISGRPDIIEAALKVVDKLGNKGLDALGKWIVSNKFTIEEGGGG